jgi:hypothetical protein
VVSSTIHKEILKNCALSPHWSGISYNTLITTLSCGSGADLTEAISNNSKVHSTNSTIAIDIGSLTNSS